MAWDSAFFQWKFDKGLKFPLSEADIADVDNTSLAGSESSSDSGSEADAHDHYPEGGRVDHCERQKRWARRHHNAVRDLVVPVMKMAPLLDEFHWYPSPCYFELPARTPCWSWRRIDGPSSQTVDHSSAKTAKKQARKFTRFLADFSSRSPGLTITDEVKETLRKRWSRFHVVDEFAPSINSLGSEFRARCKIGNTSVGEPKIFKVAVGQEADFLDVYVA